ncbi:hypothetical protein AB3S75_020388 [Citrus x aurantiifolia]
MAPKIPRGTSMDNILQQRATSKQRQASSSSSHTHGDGGGTKL